MFESETSASASEEAVNYNLVFCHACLSSNQELKPLGDCIDIYLQICNNLQTNVTSQVNVCWECLELLKKVQAFQKKVQNTQKFLQNCVRKQAPQKNSRSNYTLPSIERLEIPVSALDYISRTLDKTARITEDWYIDKPDGDENSLDDELMFRIEDVRGRCDILHVEPNLESSTSAGEVRGEHLKSPEDEERRHQRWKRSAMLVYNRICSHRYAHHFLRPVSDALAPLYSSVVHRPTDLSTIKKRVRDGGIRTTAEFTHALLLMFSNALMYNSTDHSIHHMTLELREETLRELSMHTEVEQHAKNQKLPAARARRAASVFHPRSEESQKPPAARTRCASVHHSAEHPKQVDNQKPPTRRSRRASVYHSAEHPIPDRPILAENHKPRAARTRRASVYHPLEHPKSANNKKKPTARARCASVHYSAEHPTSENRKPPAGRASRASMFHPTENSRKRAKSQSFYTSMASIEDELLVPKKFKNSEVLL